MVLRRGYVSSLSTSECFLFLPRRLVVSSFPFSTCSMQISCPNHWVISSMCGFLQNDSPPIQWFWTVNSADQSQGKCHCRRTWPLCQWSESSANELLEQKNMPWLTCLSCLAVATVYPERSVSILSRRKRERKLTWIDRKITNSFTEVSHHQNNSPKWRLPSR